MLIRSATFIKSASKLAECPELQLPEFAMIGRSNVGKSSLINMLVNIKSLVKVSAKPGKTQLMNFFLVNEEWCLVDLPGYGYAISGVKDRGYWIDTTHEYFTQRPNLKQVFVLIDGSISLQKIDIDFIQTLDEEQIPFSIVLTKMDKATQKELSRHQRMLLDHLTAHISHMPHIFSISNVSKKGREGLLEYMETLKSATEGSPVSGNVETLKGGGIKV